MKQRLIDAVGHACEELGFLVDPEDCEAIIVAVLNALAEPAEERPPIYPAEWTEETSEH